MLERDAAELDAIRRPCDAEHVSAGAPAEPDARPATGSVDERTRPGLQ